MRNIWKNRKDGPTREFITSAVICLASFVLPAVLVFNSLSDRTERDMARLLAEQEASLRRSAALCYSIEGSYPESIEYLEKNYGVSVNHDKYTVYYSSFASNIAPEIIVVPKG